MIQQVNFYPLLPKTSKYKLTPHLGARLLLGFISLLMLIYLFNYIIFFWQKQKLAAVQHTQQLAQQQLIQLNQQYEANAQNQPLSWQNKQLILQLEAKQAQLAQLKQNGTPIENGYANYLLSFAKNITPQVWLKNIHIVSVNQQIELTGCANNNAAVMEFIKNLSKEAVFKKQAFNIIKLENTTGNAATLNFTLSSKAPQQNDTSIRTTS